MWGYTSQLELAILVIRRLKWPLIILFYDILMYWQPIFATIVLAGLMVATYLAYDKDRERELAEQDDFSGGGLFYRYGQKVTSVMMRIPVKTEWSGAKVEEFSGSLRERIAERLRHRLPADSVQVTEPYLVKDKGRKKSKLFVRVFSRTSAGSIVAHFLHWAPFGRSMTLHYDSFVRGSYHWFDIAKFVAEGPITIWFWAFKWWCNQYSVLSRISHFSVDSFDDMDVDTIFNTIHHVVLDELRDLLEEEGILTPELKQMIFQQISNIQNFTVSQSSGVTIGSVAQTVPAPEMAPQAA